MVEILFLLCTRPVIDGDYVLECGFQCSAVGTVYYKSKDTDEFYKWFHEQMHPKGWTLTCGGPANPHCPKYDSNRHFYDKVYSIKKHFEGRKGREGKLGPYTENIIHL